MTAPKRGKHGCSVHLERQGDGNRWRLVKCSRHHSRMGSPTAEHPTGVPGTFCTRCGAGVTRTREGNGVREVWDLAR